MTSPTVLTMQAAPKIARLRIKARKHFLPYAMLAPALALLAGIVLYPVMYGLWLSFHDKQLMSLNATYVGLQNFKDLTDDPVFTGSVWRSAKYTAVSVVTVVVIGTSLALLLNSPLVNGRRTLRSVMFLPWLMPTVVTATTWSWLYNPTYGYINEYLKQLGVIDRSINFLGRPDLNLYALVVPLVWRGYPFAMLVLLAALQTIDSSLYEAASIDGANWWQRFWSITLPSLMAPLSIMTLLQTIWIFNHFDIPYQMTGGGPARTTELLSTYAYNTVFGALNQGYGAAIATVMFLFLLVFGSVYIKFAINRAEHNTQ